MKPLFDLPEVLADMFGVAAIVVIEAIRRIAVSNPRSSLPLLTPLPGAKLRGGYAPTWAPGPSCWMAAPG